MNAPRTTTRSSRTLLWEQGPPDQHGQPTYQAGPYRARRSYQDGKPDGWVYTDPDGSDHAVDRLRDAELAAEAHYASHGAGPAGTTKAQRLARMKRKFGIMTQLMGKTVQGLICALIVAGPPGCGKSHPAEIQIELARSQGRPVATIGGAVSPVILYTKLYEVRERGVLLIDDADGIYACEDTLNLLKRALESKPVRRVQWEKASSVLRQEGIPRSFDFTGSVIFITNKDLDALVAKGGKMSPHVEALQSRALYLPLEIDDREDLMLWITHIVEQGMLDEQGIPRERQAEILQYLADNYERMRTLSLREVMKLAGLYRACGGLAGDSGWTAAAEETLIQKDKRRS